MSKVEVIGKLGQIEILKHSCNPSTVKDGRGGIFTWVPDHDIKEFNLVIIKPNKVRGNHYHPEFIEYFLIVEGKLLLTTEDICSGESLNLLATSGMCFRTPIGVSHSFHAIDTSLCVSLLTKPWDECVEPIILQEIY